MICYFAYPIDAANGDSVLALQVAIARRDLKSVPGLCTYDPQPAWLINDRPKLDPRLQSVNYSAIDNADFMVALLPSHVSSIGVPLEIRYAADQGIPVFVLRDKPSFGLASMGSNVLQFTNMSALCAAVTENFSELVFPDVPDVDGLMADLRADARMQAVVESDVAAPLFHAHPDDAGWDMRYSGVDDLYIMPGDVVDVPCGFRIQWPENVWGLVIGRSSSFRNRGLLVNISVIDPGYRGEMFALVRNIGREAVRIACGERVAQIVPLPALAPVIDLQPGLVDGGTRGDRGFGSSGL